MTMDHAVAIGANWDHVILGVRFARLYRIVQRYQVMHLNILS